MLTSRRTDPKYEDEVSGCTASVGIITKDKIYVVSTLECTTYIQLGGSGQQKATMGSNERQLSLLG